MKQILSREDVAQAMRDLEAQGKKVTCTSLHAALGNRGSLSTLLKLKAEVQSQPEATADSPDALKLFRDLWNLASAEGKQQQEALVAQLREELTALAIENERLEGAALDWTRSNAAAEVERNRAVEAQKQLQADLVQATSQARDVMKALAEERLSHATELNGIQQQLTQQTARLHEMELQAVEFRAKFPQPAK